jgi:DNA repair exonuclease SbcCD ATPase subunit
MDSAIVSQKRIIEGSDAQIVKANRQIKEAEEQVELCREILGRREEIETAVRTDAELTEELVRQDMRHREYISCNDDAVDLERKSSAWDKETESAIARLETRIESAKKQTAVMDQVPCADGAKDSCPLLAGAKHALDEIVILGVSLLECRAEINPSLQPWDDALKKRNDLGYDQIAHDLIKKQLDGVRKIVSEKTKMDSAAVRVDDLAKRIAELVDSILELRNKSAETCIDIGIIQTRRFEVSDKLNGLKETIEAIARDSALLDVLRIQQNIANTETGRAKLSLEQAEKAEADLVEVRVNLQTVKENLIVYNLLNQAAGKKGGVPAIILENAVPEVERLANDLLQQMADGRFALRIDTQVMAKSTHEVQEAFRITVLDSGVEGPYETYSGAERFMIDLSLRVAISKFLAHRAGAEIRLLVLDEGLGVCDQENRQAVMDAIRTVSEDFAITLVITHIGELQDEFSQRVEITRDAEGSKVKVIA